MIINFSTLIVLICLNYQCLSFW